MTVGQAQQTVQGFPREIKVSLELTIEVNNFDELNYYLDDIDDPASTQKPMLADLFDQFFPADSEQLLKINGLSVEELQKHLNTGAQL